MDVYKMDAQVGLKTIALILFLNLFFYFLSAAALCHDFSLVDSVETYIAKSNSNKNSWIGLANVLHLCTPEVHTKVHNHGEGPSKRLLLVENSNHHFHNKDKVS